MEEKYLKLASYEIGWWKAHHRKNKEEFLENMCNLYVLQFDIEKPVALDAVKKRIEAAKEHDIAEKFEDEKDFYNSNIHWNKTKDLLKDHFMRLNPDSDYSVLAGYEVGWWKAHHRKKTAELLDQMSLLYSLQFGINYTSALKAVNFRVDATREHDIAEKFEDENNQKIADIHWNKAEYLLAKHFEILFEEISKFG